MSGQFTDVVLPNGRSLRVPTGDAQAAAAVARKYWAGPQGRAERDAGKRSASTPAWLRSLTQGATFGFSDELDAIGAGVETRLNNLGRRAQGKPIPYTAAQAEQAVRRAERAAEAEFAERRPLLNAGLQVGGGLLTGGVGAVRATAATAGRASVAAAARRGLLEGGAYGAAYGAGTATGNVVERAPGAAVGAAYGAGGGLLVRGGGAAAGNAIRNSKAAGVVQDFVDANVRPSMAALGSGPAMIAKAAAGNPVAGLLTRSRLNASLGDTQREAGLLAERAGRPSTDAAIGGAVREGVDTFANNRSVAGTFASRAEQNYDSAFSAIPAGVAYASNTTKALDDVLGRIGAPNLAAATRDPTVNRLARAVRRDQGSASFTDLRELRSWVRRAQSNPQLRQDIGNADLQRMEKALTQDIMDGAWALGGESAVHGLRRADQFYAAGMSRITKRLDQFFKPKADENVYDRVLAAASADKGSRDAQSLLALKRSLDPDEWGDVAATVIQGLGRPSKGAANAAEDSGFSIAKFVTGYAGLSTRGRDILFGSVGGGGSKASTLRADLDRLARVAGRQKGVEAAANNSNTMVAGQSIASVGGLTTQPLLTAKLLGALAVSGELVSNPVFVRWLAATPRNAQPGTAAAKAHLRKLQTLLPANPELQPVIPQAERILAPALAEDARGTDQ